MIQFFFLRVFHNRVSLISFIQMSLFLLSFLLQVIAHQIQNYQAGLHSCLLPLTVWLCSSLKEEHPPENTAKGVPSPFTQLGEDMTENKPNRGAMAAREGRSSYLCVYSSPGWSRTYLSSLWATQSTVFCANPCNPCNHRTSQAKPSGISKKSFLPKS